MCGVEVLPGFYLDLDRLLMAQFASDETSCDLDFVDRDTDGIKRHVKTYTIMGKVRVQRVRELLQIVEWGILTGDLVEEDEEREELVWPGEGSVRAS